MVVRIGQMMKTKKIKRKKNLLEITKMMMMVGMLFLWKKRSCHLRRIKMNLELVGILWIKLLENKVKLLRRSQLLRKLSQKLKKPLLLSPKKRNNPQRKAKMMKMMAKDGLTLIIYISTKTKATVKQRSLVQT